MIAAAPAVSLRAGYIAATAIVCLAVVFQTGHVMSYTPRVGFERSDLQTAANLATWLNGYAVEQKWTNPSISFNLNSQKFNAAALDAWSYETTRTLVGWRPILGVTIFAVSREEALSQVAESDVLILSTQPKLPAYPFHASMEELTPALRDYAQSHMRLVREVAMQQGTISVFVKGNQQ
jgi:hypothetical protein